MNGGNEFSPKIRCLCIYRSALTKENARLQKYLNRKLGYFSRVMSIVCLVCQILSIVESLAFTSSYYSWPRPRTRVLFKVFQTLGRHKGELNPVVLLPRLLLKYFQTYYRLKDKVQFLASVPDFNQLA